MEKAGYGKTVRPVYESRKSW